VGQNGSFRPNGKIVLMKNPLFVIILFFLVIQITQGQVSAYGSATVGYSSNPLYNYQNYSDRLYQTYVEVSTDKELENGSLKFQYVGGSMIFNRFSLRDYYEHRLSAGMVTKMGTESGDSTTEDGEEEESQPVMDSSGLFLLSNLQVTARHDKAEYREFNNNGIILHNGVFIYRENEFVIRFLNKIEYRYYPNLLPYNNLSEIVSLHVDNGTTSDEQYGMYISPGLKYFPNIVYDTSLFEETRSYVVQIVADSMLVGSGKQKYWEYYTYPDTSESDKYVLRNPKTSSTYQIAMGIFYQKQWDDLIVRMELAYRINSKSTLLTLVQNTSMLTLNEDLYNSVFNAHGPEFQCAIKYILPYNIQWQMNIEFEKKTFETPSYDLVTGEIANDYRKDTRINIDIYVSRYVQLTDGFGADVAISSNILRNISNDAYNDYSVKNYSFSIGISL